MPRQAKLRRHKGRWCTNAGNRQGVYFGKVTEVPYAEAKRLFRDYLASLSLHARQEHLPAQSVAQVCDAYLTWVKRERSDALYRQRKCILNHWCNHRVNELSGSRLGGHGEQTGRLRASSIKLQHAQQYIEHRKTFPCKRTGSPIGDKTQRAIAVSLKACWNWATRSVEAGGAGLLAPSHQPFKNLDRGTIAPKDLTESDLPTDVEIETLLRWATLDLSKVRAGTGRWRKRRLDECFTNPDWRVFADMLRVYHETGARTSELCDLRVRDFMPLTGQLCLGKHKRVRTQRKAVVRNIQVSKSAVKILEENARGKQSSERLFTHRNGNPWDQSKVNRRMAAVRDAAAKQGQPVRSHITPYSFRHLYISELLMIGTSMFHVAKMAGTSLGEIERTYGHFFNQDLAAAQARLIEVRQKRQRSASLPPIAGGGIQYENIKT